MVQGTLSTLAILSARPCYVFYLFVCSIDPYWFVSALEQKEIKILKNVDVVAYVNPANTSASLRRKTYKHVKIATQPQMSHIH